MRSTMDGGSSRRGAATASPESTTVIDTSKQTSAPLARVAEAGKTEINSDRLAGVSRWAGLIPTIVCSKTDTAHHDVRRGTSHPLGKVGAILPVTGKPAASTGAAEYNEAMPIDSATEL